jgi:hypothetical protein
MQRLWLIVFCIMVSVSFAQALTDLEKQITADIAIKELEIRAKIAQQEKALKRSVPNFIANLLHDRGPRDHCEDPDDGHGGGSGGGAACWNKCTSEGYGHQTCANNCGVNNTASAAACWKKCSSEGYGHQTCSNNCGTDHSGGQKACWDKCTSEGYGHQTCANNCGTSTHSGSQACWDKCTSEGYGHQTCSNNCGLN